MRVPEYETFTSERTARYNTQSHHIHQNIWGQNVPMKQDNCCYISHTSAKKKRAFQTPVLTTTRWCTSLHISFTFNKMSPPSGPIVFKIRPTTTQNRDLLYPVSRTLSTNAIYPLSSKHTRIVNAMCSITLAIRMSNALCHEGIDRKVRNSLIGEVTQSFGGHERWMELDNLLAFQKNQWDVPHVIPEMWFSRQSRTGIINERVDT
jgi:hypothetical protein